MARRAPSKQTVFRLPPWALDFIEAAAAERQTTKTQVVLDALDCLREHELNDLMAEGYEALPPDEELIDAPDARTHEEHPAW